MFLLSSHQQAAATTRANDLVSHTLGMDRVCTPSTLVTGGLPGPPWLRMAGRSLSKNHAESTLWAGFWYEWLNSGASVTGIESCGLLAVAAGGWLWLYLGLFILTLGKKIANIQLHGSHGAPAPWLPCVYVQWWHPHTYHWGRPRLAPAVRMRSRKWSFSKTGLSK